VRIAFIIISSLLTVCATAPYIFDILKKKTKPRIVSWFTWSLLTGISSAASFSAHQYPAAILSMCASLECLIVVVLGLKYGDREFVLFDIICQIAALLGLILWWLFNSPAIAIIAAIMIDFVASLPTIKHSWENPHEETWLTFALSGLGAAFTLAAVTDYKITSAANPFYLVLINLLITVVLVWRKGKIVLHT
jgi:hypothetical protein